MAAVIVVVVVYVSPNRLMTSEVAAKSEVNPTQGVDHKLHHPLPA